MKSDVPNLLISTSPYMKRAADTPAIMRHVIYSLLPAVVAAGWFFGVSALLIIATCVGGCVLTEWLFAGRGNVRYSTVNDASAILTGLLLALTLPPTLPLWMAFIGAAFAVAFGKVLFGGLGQNVFNPSLTGRAFLQASFPVALTTWAPNAARGSLMMLTGDTFALPFTRPGVDAVTTATPLAQMKFDQVLPDLANLLIGRTGGSLGETSALLLLLGGGYLAARRFLNWRIPVGIFATVYLFSTLLHHFGDPARFSAGEYQLLSGGLVLGAVFMATDPVTSPVTPLGAWLFALGVGVLVVLIRQFGGLPEGVMYSILLMNALTPLIDRLTRPRVYGTRRRAREGAS